MRSFYFFVLLSSVSCLVLAVETPKNPLELYVAEPECGRTTYFLSKNPNPTERVRLKNIVTFLEYDVWSQFPNDGKGASQTTKTFISKDEVKKWLGEELLTAIQTTLRLEDDAVKYLEKNGSPLATPREITDYRNQKATTLTLLTKKFSLRVEKKTDDCE